MENFQRRRILNISQLALALAVVVPLAASHTIRAARLTLPEMAVGTLSASPLASFIPMRTVSGHTCSRTQGQP